MKIYKLECTDQYGYLESNGYFINKGNAEHCKKLIDNYPQNKRYSIIQSIIEIETEDELLIQEP